MADPDAHALLAKSACRDLADSLPGGHKVAAAMAGVAPSVWSDYCSLTKPECSIPLHRAMRLQERTGRRDFSDLLSSATADTTTEATPRAAACSALQTMAAAFAKIEAAYADDVLTPREQQECLAELATLQARVATLQSSLAHARIGSVTPIRGAA